jgi:hypothetical protein
MDFTVESNRYMYFEKWDELHCNVSHTMRRHSKVFLSAGVL